MGQLRLYRKRIAALWCLDMYMRWCKDLVMPSCTLHTFVSFTCYFRIAVKMLFSSTNCCCCCCRSWRSSSSMKRDLSGLWSRSVSPASFSSIIHR